MERQFNKIIEIAKALKPNHQNFRAFHLTGIFKGRRLVSLATNTKKTHPFAFKMGYPYAREGLHSECLAVIRGRLEDYSGYSLIVVRLDNEGNVNSSKPCRFCERMLRFVNMKNIYYSDSGGNIQKFIL